VVKEDKDEVEDGKLLILLILLVLFIVLILFILLVFVEDRRILFVEGYK
jgi:hypothetical protein